MYSCNDYFLTLVKELFQFSGTACPAYGCRHLHKLFDCISDLFVKIYTIGYNNNCIKNTF